MLYELVNLRIPLYVLSTAGAGLHEPPYLGEDRPRLRKVLSSGSARIVDDDRLQVQ